VKKVSNQNHCFLDQFPEDSTISHTNGLNTSYTYSSHYDTSHSNHSQTQTQSLNKSYICPSNKSSGGSSLSYSPPKQIKSTTNTCNMLHYKLQNNGPPPMRATMYSQYPPNYSHLKVATNPPTNTRNLLPSSNHAPPPPSTAGGGGLGAGAGAGAGAGGGGSCGGGACAQINVPHPPTNATTLSPPAAQRESYASKPAPVKSFQNKSHNKGKNSASCVNSQVAVGCKNTQGYERGRGLSFEADFHYSKGGEVLCRNTSGPVYGFGTNRNFPQWTHVPSHLAKGSDFKSRKKSDFGRFSCGESNSATHSCSPTQNQKKKKNKIFSTSTIIDQNQESNSPSQPKTPKSRYSLM
jgi:hypothetical protein